jgi:hypothetical protein
METRDNRLKVLNEMLNGIRVVKLYAWEIPLMKRVPFLFFLNKNP